MSIQRKHILLIDDNITSLRTFNAFLQNTYDVSMAKSAAHGLAFLGKKTPDLILLDCEMPICDGLQALAMIRQLDNGRTVPVFFLSGSADPYMIRQALNLSPVGYLLKTLDKNSFLERIKNFFENQLIYS